MFFEEHDDYKVGQMYSDYYLLTVDHGFVKMHPASHLLEENAMLDFLCRFFLLKELHFIGLCESYPSVEYSYGLLREVVE